MQPSMFLLALTLASAASGASRPLTFKDWRKQTGSRDRDLYDSYTSRYEARIQAAARARLPPQNIGEVAGATFGAFAFTGSVPFLWTSLTQCRSGMARQIIFTNARRSGMRWGRLSAGFTGGASAAALLLRRPQDELVCALAGAACGGLAAANCVEQIPSTVLGFCAFTWLMHRLGNRAEAAVADPRVQKRVDSGSRAVVDDLKLLR